MTTKSRRWFRKPQCRRIGTYRPLVEYLEDRTLPSTLMGSIWNDMIADGIRAPGEPPVAAVRVVLESNGVPLQTTLTNGSGAYSFTNLAAGNYRIAPVLGVDARDVTLGGAETLTGIDFAALLAAEVPDNIDVTDDSTVQQMPSVAVNPLDSSHVVTAYMDNSLLSTGFAGIGVSVSHDGGTTWQRSSIPLPANFDQAAGHPIAQFDAQGKVFVSFMAATFLGEDSNGSSLTPGLIYDTGTQSVSYLAKSVSKRAFGMQANNGVFVARSEDGGLTWNQVSAVTSQRYDLTLTYSDIAVAAGATVTITPTVMPTDLFVNKLLIIDEGLPTMERVRVTAFTATTFTAVFAQAHAAGFTISVPVLFDTTPDLAIDTNPASPNYGNLYATWTRFYPASQFPANTATINAATATAGSQVMFAVSSDGGATWTTRLQNFTSVGKTFQVSTIRDPLTGVTTGATGTEGTGSNTLSRVTVGPEGGVYVSQFAGGRFPIFYSTNAGVSFRNPVPIGGATTPMDPSYPFGLDSGQYTSTYPTGASVQSFFQTAPLFNNQFRVQSVRAISADPVRVGTVYAVEAVPILNTSGVTIDAGEITFSRSTDFGVTWQLMFTVGSSAGNLDELAANLQFRYRSVLNDDNDGRFLGFDATPADEVISGQALPQLSVDAQGNIAVIWYDTRRDAGNKLLDVYGTVSTDGGLTFSPNSQLSSTNFDANGAANSYIGDRIGLAFADGKAYAAWTFAEPGNQDIVFTSLDIGTAPFNDRFEANDTPLTATDLDVVTVQRVVPRLSLGTGDHDWFKVEAGATGQLVIGASAPLSGSGLQMELWNSAGTIQLATGTAVIENGVVTGVKVAYQADANETYLVLILGSGAPEYTLALQALTEDLGTRVYAVEDGTLLPGSNDVYRLVAAVSGSLHVSLTSGSNVQGNLNLQILSADGQTILAQGIQPGTPGAGELEYLTVTVAAGQEVLVKVLGQTTASLARVSVSGAPVTLALGTPGTAVNFGTPAAVAGVRSVTLQGLGVNPINVLVTQRTAAGAVIGTPQSKLLNPGANVVVTFANTAGTYDIQAMDPVGSGSYRLDITNLDQFQSADKNSLFFAAGGSSSAVVAGDLNQDGIPDLILTSTQGGDYVQVLLGNADGTFQSARQFAVGAGQSAISAREPVLADFTSDGIVDLVVPNYFGADISILIGRGDGTFAPQRRFDANFKANSVTAGDFNGDGDLDLAVVDRTPGPATVSILLGRGDGTFLPPQHTTIPFIRGDASPVRVGNLNSDAFTDLIVFSANDTQYQVLLGQGDGTFTLGGMFPTGEVLFDAQLADLDGDSRLDVIIGGGNSGKVFVQLGNGDGTFQAAQEYSTAPRIGRDNIGIVGLAVVDYASATVPADGRLDVVVTTRYRSNSDVPQAFLLPGIAPGVDGKILGAAVRLGVSREAGKIAVADFNNDGFNDLAITETGGVRVVYGSPPAIIANTTPATARNLGTVVHLANQPQAIVPGFAHAYYTLTVPTEAVSSAGDQVIDFSALITNTEGAGVNMEVLDANGNVLGTGPRFRILAAQGAVLTVHIFSVSGGSGVYALNIDVLTQVVGVQAEALFPGGPITSLVITFQGDRLDPATAEDPNNYVVTRIDNGRVIPIQAIGGGKAVTYNAGANVEVSSGRTFPTAIRQTVTLMFDQPLPAGSYRVSLLPNIKTADLNSGEATQLAPRADFTGHALVSITPSGIAEGVTITANNLVAPSGSIGDLSAFEDGTAFLTQLTNDLAAELDALRNQFGDDPLVSQRINELILARCVPSWLNLPQNTPVLIIWLDPVSIGLSDPGGNRTQFNLQSNVVSNNIGRTFIEVGGTVEVIVTAAVSGVYNLNVGDVQATARGGAMILDGGNVQTVSITSEMRSGTTDFRFEFAGPGSPGAAPGSAGGNGTGSQPFATSALVLLSNAASQFTANLLPNALDATSSLVTEEFVGALLLSALSTSSLDFADPDAAVDVQGIVSAWMEVVVDAGGTVTRLAGTVLPPGLMEAGAEAMIQFLSRTVLGRLLQNLRVSEINGARPIRAAVAPPAVQQPQQPPQPEEEEEAQVAPQNQGDGFAANAEEDAVQARLDDRRGSLRGSLFVTFLVAGAAYVAVQDKEEKRKNSLPLPKDGSI